MPDKQRMPRQRVYAPDVLPEHVLEHREQFRNYVLEHAEGDHRESLTRLYRVWEQANESHFGGRLVSPYLMLTVPSNPRRLGDCGPMTGFGGRLQIRIRPSLLWGSHPMYRRGPMFGEEGRFLFVADVLLHEMVHQWQFEVSGLHDAGHHHHGTAFRDKANEISHKLGLPMVRAAKKRGKDADLQSTAYWPHIVRPIEYYLGAITTNGGCNGNANGSGSTT